MKLFSLLSCIFLTNCISLLPPTLPPAHKVDLQLHSHQFLSFDSVPWSLMIEQPMALDPYTSSKIMLNIQDNGLKKLQSCADIEWCDRLPLLVQQKLSQAFENSQKITKVGLPQENFSADYSLQLNIQKALITLKDLGDIQNSTQDLDSNKPLVELKVSAKLIRQKTLEIVAQKSFDYQILCDERTKKGFISGFEKVWSDFSYDLITWSLTTNKK